jgi:hypothetical protein
MTGAPDRRVCLTAGDCDRPGVGNDSLPAQVFGLLRKLRRPRRNSRCIDQAMSPRETCSRKLGCTNPTWHRNPRNCDRGRREPWRELGTPGLPTKHNWPKASSAPPSGGTQLKRDENAGGVPMVPSPQSYKARYGRAFPLMPAWRSRTTATTPCRPGQRFCRVGRREGAIAPSTILRSGTRRPHRLLLPGRSHRRNR